MISVLVLNFTVLDPFIVFLLEAEVSFTTCKFNEFYCKLLDLVLTGSDKFLNRRIFYLCNPFTQNRAKICSHPLAYINGVEEDAYTEPGLEPGLQAKTRRSTRQFFALP